MGKMEEKQFNRRKTQVEAGKLLLRGKRKEQEIKKKTPEKCRGMSLPSSSVEPQTTYTEIHHPKMNPPPPTIPCFCSLLLITVFSWSML